MRIQRAIPGSEFLKAYGIAITVLLFAFPCSAQSKLWDKVGEISTTRLRPARLSQAERRQIARKILMYKSRSTEVWGQDCTVDELSNESHWEFIPVSSSHKVLLVEAGSCARGEQGANGAMWIVSWDSNTPLVLASPEQRFSGWIYSIQPSSKYGYRDIVLGWHMSASETSLSYFRFNGRNYSSVGNATSLTDENGVTKIIPGRANAQ